MTTVKFREFFIELPFNLADVYFLSAELNMLRGLTDSQIQLARNWISL